MNDGEIRRGTIFGPILFISYINYLAEQCKQFVQICLLTMQNYISM